MVLSEKIFTTDFSQCLASVAPFVLDSFLPFFQFGRAFFWGGGGGGELVVLPAETLTSLLNLAHGGGNVFATPCRLWSQRKGVP